MYRNINGKTGMHSLRGTSGVLYGNIKTMSAEDIEVMLADGITAVVPVAKKSPSAEKVEAKRIKALKGTCRGKILERFSETDQAKGNRDAIKLVRKEAKVGLSEVELIRAGELELADKWINDMVLFCRAKIVNGTTTVGDLEYVDMDADLVVVGQDTEGNDILEQPVVSLWPTTSEEK